MLMVWLCAGIQQSESDPIKEIASGVLRRVKEKPCRKYIIMENDIRRYVVKFIIHFSPS